MGRNSRAQPWGMRETCWAGRMPPATPTCCRLGPPSSPAAETEALALQTVFWVCPPPLRLSSPPQRTRLPVLCVLCVSLPSPCRSATRLPSPLPSLLQQAWGRRVSGPGGTLQVVTSNPSGAQGRNRGRRASCSSRAAGWRQSSGWAFSAEGGKLVQTMQAQDRGQGLCPGASERGVGGGVGGPPARLSGLPLPSLGLAGAK